MAAWLAQVEPATLPTLPIDDIMTPEEVAVSAYTPLPEVVQIMLERRVHRVLVLRNGELAGILSAFDVLRALAADLESERDRAPVAGEEQTR